MSQLHSIDTPPRSHADGEVTTALASWVAALRHADIDADARRVASHCLLDWLGVALPGSREPAARMVRDEALAEGGHPQATLIGTAQRASALQAALVNGTASHALDFDDVHLQMPGHPTVAVMPAVVALAEREGASGEALLSAYVVGVEVAARVGRFVTEAHYARGWHATGTVGAIGAAAGCAHLLGLDAGATARAMGLAASQASGLKSMFGFMCKPLHAGRAASNGLYAASLAARGFTAREDVLECAQGFNAAFGGAADGSAALDGLGRGYAVRDVLFKYHAACYGTHAGIEALQGLRQAQGLDAAEVTRVDMLVPAANLAMCDIREPRTGLEAKFSMRHTAAMALAGVPTGSIAVYDEALCQRDDLRRLRECVQVQAGAQTLDAAAEVVVHLRDGRVHRARADVSLAEADLQRQERRLADKFATLVTPLLGAAAAQSIASQALGVDDATRIDALLAGCAR